MRQGSLRRAFPALLATALGIAGLGSGMTRADVFPVSIVDARGQTVVIERRPERVAAISTFGADLLSALGGRIAGLSTLNGKHSAFLGEAATGTVDLGEIHQVNLEVLTQLSPDLIIGLRTYTQPFEKKIEETGTFVALDLTTLDDSLSAVTRVSRALGFEEDGEALNARFLADLDAHAAKAPGGVSAVFLWDWADVPYAFYNHYFTTQIMDRLGATNVQGDSPTPELQMPDSAAISLETLLRLDPDVILVFKGEDGPFADHPVWPRLKAVKNGRAWRVNDQYVMSHGPLAREMVLREMAHLLYPDSFPEPTDIPEAARATPMTFVE
ncbi:ABC transporter substrate-binding protein [Thiorhodococcus fuscus]|uniref:ABC transporter substrate-binding protein n=1 Tax=Thiorhodococcus fuscus TaxID=527200 RepID=A0ABW4Y328_9GAMM